ncbi:MAG: ISKra4 family transposase, partial [Acidobacteriota bacterium]
IENGKAKQWSRERIAELDEGNVEAVLRSMRRCRPAGEKAKDEIKKTLHYFETNIARMRYAEFRRHGLFVGSGVIEAGCKTIVGQRLKQSGMRWSVRGANAIIALRCADLSGRWEEFWEMRAAG